VANKLGWSEPAATSAPVQDEAGSAATSAPIQNEAVQAVLG